MGVEEGSVLMALVNTETGEIIARPTYSQVRDSVATAREAGAKFFEQIVWQVERRAWEVLGHESWDAMRDAEYADMGVVVPRADRPEIVTRMRRAGLLQQEIADTLGVSQSQVQRDLNTHLGNQVDVVETSRGPRPTVYTKTSQDAPETPLAENGISEPAETTGAEGAEPAPSFSSVADQGSVAVQPEQGPACDRPAPVPSTLSRFIEADSNVQLSGWRKNFMAAIARSGELMLFTPDDVATNADVELVAELERLSHDLNKYVSRVQAKRPRRLTAIDGGNR